MADAKQLKFQFVVDEASLQKTRQLIRELIADLSKLNEVAGRAGGLTGLGGDAGGGAGVKVSAGGPRSVEQQRVIAKTAPAGRALVQNLLDQKNMFQGIASSSKESLQAMSRDLRQAVNDQVQQIDRLKRAVDALQSSYEKVRADARPAVRHKIMELQGQIDARQAAHDQLVEAGRSAGLLPPPLPRRPRGELMPEVPWPERPPQMVSGGQQPPSPPAPSPAPAPEQQMSHWARFKSWIGFGGGLGGPGGGPGGPDGGGGGLGWFGSRQVPSWLTTALRIGGLVLGGANTTLNEVTAQNVLSATLGAERGSLVRQQLDRLWRGDIRGIMAMQSLDADDRKALLENSVGTIGTANIGKNAILESIKGGVAMSDKGIMGAWQDEALETARAQRAWEHVQKFEAARPFDNLATEKFMGELGQRIQFQRLTGTGGHGARNRRGRHTYTYDKMESKLTAQGYAPMEYAMATAQLRNLAGEGFAGENAWTAMAATAEGMSGFADLMGAAARSGGGMKMALGALGGGIDRFAGVHLGQQIIGSGFDPRGTTSGLGLLQAVQAGMKFTDTAQDFNLVQRVGLGLQMGDAIVGGEIDPYQQARNLVGAIQRTGPGTSTFVQDFLASGMTMKQMVDIYKGKAKGTAIDTVARGYLGENYQDIIRGQLGDSITSVLERFVDQGGDDALSQVMRRFRKSGSKDIVSFLGSAPTSAEERAMLADFYRRQTGGTLEGGIGLMDILAGLDSDEDIKNGYVGKKVTGVEADALKNQAKVVKEVNDQLERLTESLANAYNELPTSFNQAKYFVEKLDASADHFIKSLGLAAKAVDKFRLSLEGKDQEAPTTPPRPLIDLVPNSPQDPNSPLANRLFPSLPSLSRLPPLPPVTPPETPEESLQRAREIANRMHQNIPLPFTVQGPQSPAPAKNKNKK